MLLLKHTFSGLEARVPIAIAQTSSPITDAKIGKVFHVDWDFSLKSRVAENNELTDTAIWLW